MNDFKELKTPSQSWRGWHIATVEDEPTAWLTTSGDITSSTMDLDILFFDDELAAHKAAVVYYVNNGERYPYLQQALDVGMRATAAKSANADGSRVMDFI